MMYVLADAYDEHDVALYATVADADRARLERGDEHLTVQPTEVERPAFDAVAAVFRKWSAERDRRASCGPSLASRIDGIRECVAAVAALRYVVEPAKFGPHWWEVRDTWTGWSEVFAHGQKRDDDRYRADEHAQALNAANAAAALDELNRAATS